MPEHIRQFSSQQIKTATPQSRQADKKWYQSKRWRTLRRMVLARDPICARCRLALAVDVHHIKPRKDYPELQFVESNLIGLCVPCHRKIEHETGERG